MKFNLNKRNLVIICALILIVVIAIGIVLYKKVNDEKENIIEEIAIDIWRDNSMDASIDLYSIGTGDNQEIYLGEQPIHYQIKENGDVYKYQESEFKNKKTGKRRPATIEKIKTLSNSDFEKLKEELQSIVENYKSTEVIGSTFWYIKIKGNSTRVKADVQNKIIDKYIYN